MIGGVVDAGLFWSLTGTVACDATTGLRRQGDGEGPARNR